MLPGTLFAYLVTKVDNVRAALHARCPVDKGDRLVRSGAFVCIVVFFALC